VSTIKTRNAFLFKFSGDVIAATDTAAIEARLYIVHGFMSFHVLECGVGGFVPLFVEALDDHFFSYVQIWFSLNYVEYFTFCFFVRVHSI
jgi:voltage-gated potassium channel Kch